jgi:exopolysaccharide biosynthesis polyprenyl glycosylphosphotransferase
MIRLFHAYFPKRTVLLTLSEAVLLIAAFLLAVLVAAGTTTNAGIFLLYENGIGRIAFIVTVVLVMIYYFDLYSSMVLSNTREVFTRLVGVLGCTFLALALFYFAFPDVKLNGKVLWFGLIAASVALPAWRSIFFMMNRSPRFAERALILGDGPLAGLLSSEIGHRPELGVRVAGAVVHDISIDGVRTVDASDLMGFGERTGIRRVILTASERRGTLPLNGLLDLKSRGVQILDGAQYYESITGKLSLDSLRLGWLLFSPGFRVGGVLRFYKRSASIVLSSLALVILSPVLAVVALAIRLDSKGPVIFKQSRVGEGGKTFLMYKFRTMYAECKNGKHDPAAHGDSRVTRVGKWLRPPRLDELPQLVNILRGDMAFVGPRPFVPDQEEQYAARIPFYRQRWLIKPGATGWAQINRGYNATLEDNKEKLAYDLFYIKNISAGLDLFVMLSTAKILLLGRGGR